MSLGDPTSQGHHHRTSTEEQIALAIANSKQDVESHRKVGAGEWACLQCTFVNSHNGVRCAMCLCTRPASEQDQAREQGSRNPLIGGMYGNQPPPAASQPSTRSLPKTSIPASQHRRMTTEEQITLAIEQSIEAKIEEPVEMFERKPVEMFDIAEKKQDDGQHRRMTTEEQINRAIQISSSLIDDGDLNNEKQDGNTSQVHRRMSTEEQISKAITQSAEDEAEQKDLDLINAAIESAGTVRSWSTEDMIDKAINKPKNDESTGQDNFDLQYQVEDKFMDTYVKDILENPAYYKNCFAPPPGLFFGPREVKLVKRFIKALDENKQEINKTRISLNKERRANEDLKYEFEILFNKCAQLEQSLQQAQEEVEAVRTQNKELENRLDKKAVELEDTFEKTVSNENEPHRREPSYAGIGELFAKDQELAGGQESLDEDFDHERKPSYRGVQEMFQDQKITDLEHNQEKANQDQENPQQKSEGPSHVQQASYGGISELFKGDTGAVADASTEKHATRASKVRAPSYGGIREMFMDDDENVDGHDEDLERGKKQEREASSRAVQQVFEPSQIADQEPVKEEEDIEIADTLEEDIQASFDVVWNLLVEKVHHPEKYLPVEDVAVEHRDGKWIRHMFLTPMEIVITEEININHEEHTIQFVDHNFPDLKIVNILERTDDPKKQRVIFYKQNRESGMKIASVRLLQMFRTDVHFLKRRAAQKMSLAVHEREPSYGGVPQYDERVDLKHGHNTSFGGVGNLGTTAKKPAQSKSRHVSKMSYGGIRTMFDQNDSRQLMVRLQEEVFRVMDMHPWSEITKGMVVQEVEDALGFELESFHRRFIKITIMRIIDGKLKLECFAGENVKNQVVNDERQAGKIHTRDVSYGGVQEMFEDDNDWRRKEIELDELYTKTQERELDRLYNRAQSASGQAIEAGGFKDKRKTRDEEKEIVRKTQKHSRNVSYGGVRYMDPNKEDEEQVEVGPEVVRVAGTVHSRNASNQYFTLGGFQDKGQNLEALNEEVVKLRNDNIELMQQNEDLRLSKMQLVQTCSGEIERLRSLLNPSVKS